MYGYLLNAPTQLTAPCKCPNNLSCGLPVISIQQSEASNYSPGGSYVSSMVRQPKEPADGFIMVNIGEIVSVVYNRQGANRSSIRC